jgi:ribosomal protein S19
LVRSKRKNIYISDSLVASYKMNNKNNKLMLLDLSRNNIGLSIFLYKKILTYNGRNFFNVYMKSIDYLKYKISSFSLTKKKCVFFKKKKK